MYIDTPPVCFPLLTSDVSYREAAGVLCQAAAAAQAAALSGMTEQEKKLMKAMNAL